MYAKDTYLRISNFGIVAVPCQEIAKKHSVGWHEIPKANAQQRKQPNPH
jgi:hypothetical protein